MPEITPQSEVTTSERRPLVRRLLTVLLVLSVVYFSWRSIPRALASSQDLTVGYTAAHALIAGQNPYDPAVLAGLLAQHGAANLARTGLMDFMRNVYFPVTLPLYLPLTLFAWPVAKTLWLLLNLVGVVMICWGLLRCAGMPAASNRGLAFLGFAIALAPIHSTIAMGQTAVLSTAAIVVAMLLERRGSRAWAGVAYGLATAIKVQIGLPFLAYVLWRRRWPTAGASLAVVVGLTLFSVGAMEHAGTGWFASWQTNVRETTTGGGHNDPSLANPGRHSMIGLPVLLHNFTDNRALVNGLTYALVLGGALYAMYHIRGRYPAPDRELLALSTVAILGLLVAYHRTYDAVILSLPLAWAIGALGGVCRRYGAGVLLLFADFLLPAQTMVAMAASQGRLFPSLTKSVFWDSILPTQQVWATVLMAVCLLVALTRARTDLAGFEQA